MRRARKRSAQRRRAAHTTGRRWSQHVFRLRREVDLTGLPAESLANSLGLAEEPKREPLALAPVDQLVARPTPERAPGDRELRRAPHVSLSGTHGYVFSIGCPWVLAPTFSTATRSASHACCVSGARRKPRSSRHPPLLLAARDRQPLVAHPCSSLVSALRRPHDRPRSKPHTRVNPTSSRAVAGRYAHGAWKRAAKGGHWITQDEAHSLASTDPSAGFQGRRSRGRQQAREVSTNTR